MEKEIPWELDEQAKKHNDKFFREQQVEDEHETQHVAPPAGLTDTDFLTLLDRLYELSEPQLWTLETHAAQAQQKNFRTLVRCHHDRSILFIRCQDCFETISHVCGVDHSAPCEACHGKGFHKANCSTMPDFDPLKL